MSFSPFSLPFVARSLDEDFMVETLSFRLSVWPRSLLSLGDFPPF
jgi:hypothetical protein